MFLRDKGGGLQAGCQVGILALYYNAFSHEIRD